MSPAHAGGSDVGIFSSHRAWSAKAWAIRYCLALGGPACTLRYDSTVIAYVSDSAARSSHASSLIRAG